MRYHKYNRKLSNGHQQILSDISRRATINEIPKPKSLSEYSKKKCKKESNIQMLETVLNMIHCQFIVLNMLQWQFKSV